MSAQTSKPKIDLSSSIEPTTLLSKFKKVSSVSLPTPAGLIKVDEPVAAKAEVETPAENA